MKRYFTVLLVCFFIMVSSTNIEAKEKVNTKAIANEGFEDVSEIYNQMSPQQKEDVYKKAMSMMEEIKDKSPSEIEQLKQQMLQMQNSLDFKQIKIEKLDTKKDLSLDKIQNDINKHNMQR